jgi:hypothetical protein
VAVFSKPQRQFIVRRLAAFDTPRDVVIAFKARFPDTDCTENDVLATDPRVALVDPELQVVFDTERARIITDPASAPYADQAARLIVLSRDVDRYRANNDVANARAVLRQIAEELGVGGKGGAAPKDAGLPSLSDLTVTRTIVDPAASC